MLLLCSFWDCDLNLGEYVCLLFYIKYNLLPECVNFSVFLGQPSGTDNQADFHAAVSANKSWQCFVLRAVVWLMQYVL